MKLSGRTRRADQPDEKLDLAATLSLNVRDERRAAVDFELGFANVMFKNRLILGIELTELDRGARQYYERIREAVGAEAGNQILDVLKPVPYLELATKVADGLIKAFGNASPDKVWSSNPVFAVDPLPGAPYLRTGIYVAFEDPRGNLSPSALSYTDQQIIATASGQRLERNHLVFTVGVERAKQDITDRLQD